MTEEIVIKVDAKEALRQVLEKFSMAYFLQKPSDFIDFAVEYFGKLKNDREAISNSNTDSVLMEESDEGDAPPVILKRHESVFGEPFDPESDSDDKQGSSAVFPKSVEQRDRLAESVKHLLPFRSIEKEEMDQLLNAMSERKVKAGDLITRQGDEEDFLYSIERGVYKVIKDDVQVDTYNNSGIFGDMDLLYNTPRSATVVAETEGMLWALDRQTFRRILLKAAYKKHKRYEELLEDVPILKTLKPVERMNLADVLITKHFVNGQSITKQGDEPDGMYFIEEGQVSIKVDQDGGEVEIAKRGKGAYFGELALITHRPRAASAYAIGDVKVAFLETEAFERILGHLSDVFQRDIESYEEKLKTFVLSSSAL